MLWLCLFSQKLSCCAYSDNLHCICNTYRKTQKDKTENYLLLIAFALLPIIPWAIAWYLRDGTVFFIAMLQTDVVERVGTSGPPWYFNLADMLSYPSVVIARIIGLSALGHKVLKGVKLTRKQIGFLVWNTIPIILSQFITYKLYPYIYLIMPTVAISGSLAVGYWVRHAPKNFISIGCTLALVVALSLTIENRINYSMHRVEKGSYQTALSEMFDREMDYGLHVYIQTDEVTYAWAQCDILYAIMSGAVECLDGSIKAFEQDEEPAIVFIVVIDKTCLKDSLLENYPVYYESLYLVALSN